MNINLSFGIPQGQPGAKGDPGPAGERGLQGPRGYAGQDGSQWLFGTNPPTTGQGVENDWYICTSTWEVYHRTAVAWVLQGIIKGTDGAPGSKWLFGAVNPDNAVDGKDGDWWLNTASLDIFVKVSGSWELQGDISGITSLTFTAEAHSLPPDAQPTVTVTTTP